VQGAFATVSVDGVAVALTDAHGTTVTPLRDGGG
jgi:hypothetical protein